MKAAIRTSSRGALQPLERVQDVREARRRAEQDGAERAEDRLGADRGERRQALLGDVTGPSSIGSPLRTNGTKSATNSTSGSTTPRAAPERARADRARAPRSRSARRAQADVDRPRVQRRRDRDERDARAARSASPAGPGGGSGCAGRRRRRRGGAGRSCGAGRLRASSTMPKPSANTSSVPVKPARPVASRSFVDAGERVVGDRAVLRRVPVLDERRGRRRRARARRGGWRRTARRRWRARSRARGRGS